VVVGYVCNVTYFHSLVFKGFDKCTTNLTNMQMVAQKKRHPPLKMPLKT
jgi:hypothetical protein